MAALGTIRKRGAILVAIIGLGLFAFIAEEFVRSCEATGNAARQQVGEVLGEKISVQEFQARIRCGIHTSTMPYWQTRQRKWD